MKLYFWALVLPLLGGCGDKLVPEEKQTSVEKLQSTLSSWCEKACERFGTCGLDVPEGCARACEQELSEYVHSETCADRALQMQTCIDYSSCKQLTRVDGWPNCYPGEAERRACSHGDDIEPMPTTGSGGAPDE